MIECFSQHSLYFSFLEMKRCIILWLVFFRIRDKLFNNLYIRTILTKVKIFFSFCDCDFFLWSDINTYLIPNKVKETHFKIINRYYPCNDFINKFEEGISLLCGFCKEESETILPLFFSWSDTRLFWSQVCFTSLLL